jgi:hypothetical protein
MKSLGDSYVKSEFRLHQGVTKEDQLTRFFSEWNNYLQQIEQGARARASQAAGITDGQKSKVYSFGADLDKDVELTDEQYAQLENLRTEAGNVHKK